MERSQTRQASAHLLGIAEVERLAHALVVLLCGRVATLDAGLPRLPEGGCVAGLSLIRPGRYEVQVFIEEDVLQGCCGTHGRMLGEGVRAGSRPFVPLASERQQRSEEHTS